MKYVCLAIGLNTSFFNRWSSEVENLTKMFELQITNKDNNHVQVLSCEGSKTVLELRQEIIGLFDIPYRKQEWNGFPGTNPPDDDVSALLNDEYDFGTIPVMGLIILGS